MINVEFDLFPGVERVILQINIANKNLDKIYQNIFKVVSKIMYLFVIFIEN